MNDYIEELLSDLDDVDTREEFSIWKEKASTVFIGYDDWLKRFDGIKITHPSICSFSIHTGKSNISNAQNKKYIENGKKEAKVFLESALKLLFT